MEGVGGGVSGGSPQVLEPQGSQSVPGEGSDGASMSTDLLVKMLVDNMRENCRFEFEKKSAGILAENKRLQDRARKAEAKSVRVVRQNKRLRGIVQLLEGEVKEAQDKLKVVKASMATINEAQSQAMLMDLDGDEEDVSRCPEGAADPEESSSTSLLGWTTPQKDPLGDPESDAVPDKASAGGTYLGGRGKGQLKTPPKASTSSVTSNLVEMGNESSVGEPESTLKEDDKQNGRDNISTAASNGEEANVSNPSMIAPPRSPSPKLLNEGLLNIPVHPPPQLKLLQKRSKAIGKRRKVWNPEGVMDLSAISLACIDDLIYGGNRDRSLPGMRSSSTSNLNGCQRRHRRRRRCSGSKSKSSSDDEEVILIHKEDSIRGVTEGGFFCICGGETFSTKVNLQQHVRYYNTDWKFSCIVCGARFYSLGYLKVHLRKYHQRSLPLGVIGCTKCGECFPSSKELITHRRTVGCGGRMRKQRTSILGFELSCHSRDNGKDEETKIRQELN